MHLSRRKVEFWLHAGLFSLYLGTLSLLGLAERLNETLGNLAQVGLLGLTLLLLIVTVLRTRRVPMFGLVLLGLLPYAHYAFFWATGESTAGAFIYLYKFGGFLLAPFVWWWARRHDDGQVERVVMLLALVAAVRALLAFALPGLHPGAAGGGGSAFADDFSIYERVGGLARVFYPGMALVFLGLLMSLENALSGRVSRLWPEVFKVGLFFAALLVTFSRGTIIFAVLLTVLYVLVRVLQRPVAQFRLARIALGGVVVLGALTLVLSFSSLGASLGDSLSGLQRSDRLTLDRANITWRERQVDLAFSLVNTDAERVWGVGTNTLIPSNPDLLIGATNDLHYSYHSILWTFGYVGLGLLVAFGIVQPLVRALWARGRWVLPFAFTTLFIALVGGYTIVFTSPDWNFMVGLCAAYLSARAARPQRVSSPETPDLQPA
ncbi:O-antigen ligase family protein [Deinococcus planocerae]|uniref:O-antigen ligase family protein n=1 Tax=Deinococcus planocerae TaxID=1737569 RepID=UPI0011AF3AAD|nr:O-antigen ligase family protein [Deinococcus planocerae]